MTDLTEKNLKAVLLNLTKTDKPITVKPTTWFGNPAKTAQWYTCPNCGKQSPLTLEWVGLTDEEIKEIVGPYGDTPIKGYTRQLFDKIEAKLKEKNDCTPCGHEETIVKGSLVHCKKCNHCFGVD